jgi:pyrimidine-specific ribonucleoside hydrolase
MKHIIIDTDPGVDDALALMLAFSSPELKVEAVTTVAGNVSLERAKLNAMKILEFLGVDSVPVAAGAIKPLLRESSYSTEFHGETGLGEAVLPEPKLSLDARSAIQLIIEKAEELVDRLILVALGPLTNIAATIVAMPDVVDIVGELVIMGGAFNLTPYGLGNANAVAEFNIWYDPEAAKIVFDSGIPMRAVGLDVTTNPDNRLSEERFEEIERLGTRRACLVADICRGIVRMFKGFSLHDPMAVATVAEPSLVETERFKVDVETVGALTRGMTVVDRRYHRRVKREEANVDVCVKIDSERFLKLFFDRVIHGRE